jgi:uncharacterized protein YciI
VEAATADHRAWAARMHAEGKLLASGPFSPRTGGMLLLSADSRDDVDLMLCDDPFLDRAIATYEVREWAPTLGRERF